MGSELLPCPFCGGMELQVAQSPVSDWCEVYHEFRYVQCNRCLIKGPGINWKNPTASDAAIAAWNTRRSPWQPIETAPKDYTDPKFKDLNERFGPNLLLWCGNIQIGCWNKKLEFKGHVIEEGWRDNGEGFDLEPTLWMPLPSPV